MIQPLSPTKAARRRRHAGFSLIELMISIGLSLVILAALSAMLVNVSSANSEMAKSNGQIENGRFAIQTLEADLVHAGFWGGFVPQFDDLNWPFLPADVPLAIPDPCLEYTPANWTFDHINDLLGIAVQSGPAAPGTCVLANQKAGTDVLVVRHAALCLPGEAGCEPDTAGKLYFQSSLCAAATAGTARMATAPNLDTKLRLVAPANGTTTSNLPGAYVGMTIHTTGGTGPNQTRKIVAYDRFTHTVTVSEAWTVVPDNTTTYAIMESRLSTDDFSLKGRNEDCGAVAAVAAPKRKFDSSIYYIRSYSTVAGDGIPTLVRAAFDPAGAPALAHQAPEALVEGIDGFAVELGIDNRVARCNFNTPTNYGDEVEKVDPTTCALSADPTRNMLPKNRGDGNPDAFVRCTAAVPCTVEQLRDVVAVKLYLLVRNTELTKGYSDAKVFCLAARNADNTCPNGSSAGPFTDNFKRHLFTTTVRLTTISGRRETPQ